jgi:hypothetical protein
MGGSTAIIMCGKIFTFVGAFSYIIRVWENLVLSMEWKHYLPCLFGITKQFLSSMEIFFLIYKIVLKHNSINIDT